MFLDEAEITEQDSFLHRLALPMRYRRVVDLHHMLGGDSNQTSVRRAKELKHLRLLRMAVIYMMMCVLNLYEYAKKNSGPLKSIVWCMEVAMITIVGPVYRRFKGVPDDFLVLLDNKKALGKIQTFVNKAQSRGLHTAAIHDAATGYKQFLFNQSMKFWVGLEYLRPPIHSGREGYTSSCVLVPEIQPSGERLDHEGFCYLRISTFGSTR